MDAETGELFAKKHRLPKARKMKRLYENKNAI